jgi:hypothetical protein
MGGSIRVRSCNIIRACHISNRARLPLKRAFKYKGKKLKEKGMYEIHLQYGYTLKEIAAYIGLHYTYS